MRDHIRTAVRHPLLTGSSVIFAASLLGSVFNFIFNLYMGRNLNIADYGVLASVAAIITLATVLVQSVTPTIVSFASVYFVRDDLPKVSGMFVQITKYFAGLGGVVFLMFLIFSGPIGVFFHITSKEVIIMTGVMIFIVFLAYVNVAFLQARVAFNFLSFSTFVGTLIKLISGIGMVTLGFGLTGGILAYFLSLLVPYFMNFYPVKFVFRHIGRVQGVSLGELASYGLPSSIAMFSLTSLASTDLILVKHFFSPASAGIYAGFSLVGKVIFYFSAPIGLVMFPLISRKHAKGESYDSTFFLAIALVLIPSVCITIFYFLFPQFSITFFVKRREYLSASGLLGLYAVFISIYSLLTIMVNFFLSIKKTFIYIFLLLGATLQILLISFFHGSFLTIVQISLIISVVLLVFFLGYYVSLRRKILLKT